MPTIMLLNSRRTQSVLSTLHRLVSLWYRRQLSADTTLSSLVRPITVRTCIGLYPKLHQQNPTLWPANVSADGVSLQVDYVDTAHVHPPAPDTKTILALPGAAGNYTHFKQIISHFASPNVRVISPNFPDFSHTRSTGLFWHTNTEKVTFLKDFLSQIDVQKIDCAVSHSMGMHTVLELFNDPEPIQINSVALLAPQPLYDLTEKQIRLSRRLFFTFRHPLFFDFFNWTRFHKLPQIPVKFSHGDDLLLFLVPVLDASLLTRRPLLISKLANSTVPVSVLYGTGEKFISQCVQSRLLTELTIPPEDICTIDPETDSVERISEKKAARLKGFYLKGGGHFAYANFNQFTNQMIQDLLDFPNKK